MSYESFDVPVTGGLLHVGRWGSGPAVVVAAHGVTGTHMNFEPLADQLGEAATVLAPDLRGRGVSRSVGGPYGMARHADDVIAVLDHAGIAEATMVGHSMGGFVAVTAAARHPDRIRCLVLVDGGLPLQLGPLAALPVDQAVRALIGPSLDRLKMTFPSRQAYLDFWRDHPALASDWNDYIERSFSYDTTGETAGPDLYRSRGRGARRFGGLSAHRRPREGARPAHPARRHAACPAGPVQPGTASVSRRSRKRLARASGRLHRSAGARRQPLHDRADQPRRKDDRRSDPRPGPARGHKRLKAEVYGGSGSRVSPVWARNPLMSAGRYWMVLSRLLTIAASWSTSVTHRLPSPFFRFAQAPSVALP